MDETTRTATPPQRAAGRVAADLVMAGLVHPERAQEAEQVVARSLAGAGVPAPDADRRGAGTRLAEIAGYVGGALVLAAIGLLLATGWAELSGTAQVTLLAVVTVLLGVAGAVAARLGGGTTALRTGGDEVRRRLTSALLTGAAVTAALSVGRLVMLTVADYSSEPSLGGGLTLVALGMVGYRVAPSALGQLGVLGGALVAATSLLTLLGDDSSAMLVPGLVVLALGAGWLALAELGVLHEPVVGRFLAVATALAGAQLCLVDAGHDLVAYGLTLLVAVGGFVLYVRTMSWPYLVAGVAGITLVVPEAVMDWTDGSMGVAGGVLVAGLTLLAAGLVGLRLRQEARD
jgi:hypothetical protein